MEKNKRLGKSHFTFSGSRSPHVCNDQKHKQVHTCRSPTSTKKEYSTEPMLSQNRLMSHRLICIKWEERFSQLPVERAEVEVMICLTGWKTKCTLTTAGKQWRINIPRHICFYPSNIRNMSQLQLIVYKCNTKLQNFKDFDIFSMLQNDVAIVEIWKEDKCMLIIHK